MQYLGGKSRIANSIAKVINENDCEVFVSLFCGSCAVETKVKGYTSKILRDEFTELSKMHSSWTRNYFVSTSGNVCSETIKKYLENQKKRY